MKKYKWENTCGTNVVLYADDFCISYNPGIPHPLFIGPFFIGASNFFDLLKEETALCKDNEYFILNGDHRNEYEKIIHKGFEECKKFYDYCDEKSIWSSN